MRRPSSLLLLLAVATACGDAPLAPPAAGSLQRGFAHAALAYDVPVEVLQGIAWVETRFRFAPGERALDGAYGPMRLVDREDDRSLQLASELTGLSREALLHDPEAHLRGGAAVLRHEADRVFAAYPALREDELSDWYDVVTRRSGFADLRLAEEWANRVFYAIAHGASRTLPDGQRVTLRASPVHLDGKRAFGETQQFSGTDGFPGARWVAASSENYTPGREGNPINFIIVHTTQGSYNGAISWFQNPAASVSAHYVISQGGDCTQMVHHEDTGWHAGNWTYNQQSIGFEHEGWVDDPDWATPALYETSAALARFICDRHGIPRDRAHILGHIEVPGATHTDPGPHWDWDHYMALIGGGAPATGVLRGVIYVDPNTDERITDATVSLSSGASMPVSTSGAYRFEVPPGDYTLTASAPGYASRSLQRTVTAGTETWGSIGLSVEVSADVDPPVITIDAPVDGATLADVSTIEVRGSVTDASPPAEVRVAGVLTSLSDGRFSAPAPLQPGANTLTVVAVDGAGNEAEASVTVLVTAGTTLGAVRGFVFHAPDPAARIAGARVELRSGAERRAETGTGPDGSFSLEAEPGDYTLVVRATGYQAHEETVVLAAGAPLLRELGLYPGEALPLVITSPEDGATILSDEVRVEGQTAFADGELTVNGVVAERTPDGAGFRFVATVALEPDEATIRAVLVRGGAAIEHVITIQRPDTGSPGAQAVAVDGGCGCTAGDARVSLFPLLGLLGALGLRRRPRSIVAR